MIQTNHNLKDALDKYILALDKREYFLAHEILEEAWHPLRISKSPLANLLKGMINASIAFEHIKRDRAKAKSKAQKVIKAYDRYKGIDKIIYKKEFEDAILKIDMIRDRLLPKGEGYSSSSLSSS
jgi:hypothetical protein